MLHGNNGACIPEKQLIPFLQHIIPYKMKKTAVLSHSGPLFFSLD